MNKITNLRYDSNYKSSGLDILKEEGIPVKERLAYMALNTFFLRDFFKEQLEQARAEIDLKISEFVR